MHTKSVVGAARVLAGSRRKSVASANKENITILTVKPYLKIVRGVFLNIIAIIVVSINTCLMHDACVDGGVHTHKFTYIHTHSLSHTHAHNSSSKMTYCGVLVIY